MSDPAYSFPAHLQSSGCLRFPVAVDARVVDAAVSAGQLAVRCISPVRSMGRGALTVPRAFARALGAPVQVTVELRLASPEHAALLSDNAGSVVLPLGDGGVWFPGKVGKKEATIELPSALARGILGLGWGTYVEVEAAGEVFPSNLRLFGEAAHRVILPVPPHFPRGSIHLFHLRQRVTVEDVPRPLDRFDWAAFVPEGAGAVHRSGDRVEFLRGRRLGLAVQRYLSMPLACWYLGAYLAEGAKSDSAGFWGFSGTLPGYVREMAAFLRTECGIADKDIGVYVIVPDEDCLETAASVVEGWLGLPVTRARHNRPLSTVAVTLSPRRSKLLKEATCAALEWFRGIWELLPRAALRRFVDGYLSGDGSVTLSTTRARLGLSGPEDEIRWVGQVLDHAYEWPGGQWSASDEHSSSISRSLRPHQALALLTEGAFRHSMARGRLLSAFEAWFRDEGSGAAGELDHLRALGVRDFRTYWKCVPYPLAPGDLWTGPSSPVKKLVAQREARWWLSQHVPYVCGESAADHARQVLLDQHYLGSYPSGWTVPVVDLKGGGVAVFSISANPNLAKYLFGHPIRLLELGRLWSPDGAPQNYLSVFLATCLRGLRRSALADAVVSYADPEAGHLGTIYKATNWVYTGTTDPGMVWVRGSERYPRRHFHGAGGPIPDREIREMGFTKQRTVPKHRYVYLLGSGITLKDGF